MQEALIVLDRKEHTNPSLLLYKNKIFPKPLTHHQP
jgi:hypothetical protein